MMTRRLLAWAAATLMWLGTGAVGAAPPAALELQAATLDGDTVELSGLRGRVTIVTFWATWCFPCRYELPLLEALYRRLGPRGLQVIAIATQDELAAVKAYQQEQGFSFHVLFDGSGTVMRAFGARAVPATYVIDSEGALVAVQDPATGERSTLVDNPLIWQQPATEQLLERLLAEGGEHR